MYAISIEFFSNFVVFYRKDMHILPKIVLDLGSNEMLLPYLQRLFPLMPGEDPQAPVGAVKIRCAGHAPASDDAEFEKYCSEHALPVATLACCDIIGTGMRGLPRRIAERIARGTLVHIRGNEARISLVHATDVARAVSMLCGCQGAYTLSDGREHTMHDLADAIAYRMNDKRLYTVAPRWARLWYGAACYSELTTDHLFESAFAADFPEFVPVDTIDYMHTHVYDHTSL